MVLGTGKVLGSKLVAADNFKVGLDDGTDLVSLTGSLEGSNVGIQKGGFLGDPIEEAIYGS